MTTHDFTSGYRIRKEDAAALLYNKIFGTKPGVKKNDIMLLNYKGRKTSNLIIDVEYKNRAESNRFSAIIIFLDFVT